MATIQSVLIANRGEIALRIMACCRKLNIRTIAICSEDDQRHPHAREADVSEIIGKSPADVYLNAKLIVEVARKHGASAIHPGYGYLSESAAFAALVEQAGILFVGPRPDTLELFGEKHRARSLAQSLGIPVSPGESEESGIDLVAAAARVGFPLMVKAVAGGGGRGMRRVDVSEDLAASVDAARQEAQRAFGDARLLLERLVTQARHIEVQLLGDGDGKVLCLGERDCSFQRRYQKIIEEAPAIGLSSELRASLHEAALALGRAARLRSAATVEFLVLSPDEAARFGTKFLFLEANCRIQVEHPVTEEVTGVDLIEKQFQVASGFPLPESSLPICGHAIELRIYAEDPVNSFVPQVGTLHSVELPVGSGLRFDHIIRRGVQILSDFDPMIGKLIATGTDRQDACSKALAALRRVRIGGIRTNCDFLADVLSHRTFKNGEFNTDLFPLLLDDLKGRQQSLLDVVAGLIMWFDVGGGDRYIEHHFYASAGHDGAQSSEFSRPALRYVIRASLQSLECILRPLRIVPSDAGVDFHYLVDGRELSFQIDHQAVVSTGQTFAVSHREDMRFPEGNMGYRLVLDGLTFECERVFASGETERGGKSVREATSNLPGKISRILVAAGDVVHPGMPLFAVDSMKMEHIVSAREHGRVSEIRVTVGEPVRAGQAVVRFEDIS